MARTNSSARRRLIKAALDLFLSQGFTETTTRQIAELAQVNEATLFRNFGNKRDLLLSVIKDSGLFTRLDTSLKESIDQTNNLPQALKRYSHDCLEVLGQMSELLRSVVGEARHYSVENRQTLGQGIAHITKDLTKYLTTIIEQEQLQPRLPIEQFAGLLNGMLFGYLIIELTSEFHELWDDRENFIDSFVELCLYGIVSPLPSDNKSSESLSASSPLRETISKVTTEERIADLPAELVRSILQQAKKRGIRDYALAYLLFASGLLPTEIVILQRSHHICNSRQQLVQINQGAVRQVPVNQWVMGKRYGSYTNNPLSQWLKSRKDEQSALFINNSGQPLSEAELLVIWQQFTTELLTPEQSSPDIKQARQTWCVEMLMKGMSSEDLSILSGWTIAQLQPYVLRAKEKAALERAIQLDQKLT